MATFCIHLMAQKEPLSVDLPFDGIDQLVDQASSSRYIVGHLAVPDEEGVCRRVMIATSRIQCAVEVD
ncbi:hypothetical protein AAW01_12665 [Aurantiacibacter gangjinensis]|uniref:Uncharacterized protein n=1 Tax=Aurantiacibacter gangjinensis TaxID=502682 RepID=A0A0G9MP50_9SPHN|nr:hypothetical protein AAW01_12665 [Aurantiacibacter gangjinensis]